MKKITYKDITITRHPVDGYSLSYLSDNGEYYHQRYIGYGIREAKKRFKNYLLEVLK